MRRRDRPARAGRRRPGFVGLRAALLLAVGLTVACEPSPEGSAATRAFTGGVELAPQQRADLQRAYLQGLELTRDGHYGRARAELGRCLELDPSHAGARFGLARLDWHRGERSEAIAALTALLLSEPDNLLAHAFLLDVYETVDGHQDGQLARPHRRVLRQAYGSLFDFDRKLWMRQFGGGPNPYAEIKGLADGDPEGRSDDPLVNLARAARLRTQKHGYYRPLEANQIYERLFERYPLALSLCLEYVGRLLTRGIRFPLIGEPGLPPMNSSITLDVAQRQYERVLDRCRLDAPVAHKARLGLVDVALRMGDWDSVVRRCASALQEPGLAEVDARRLRFLTGVAFIRAGDLERAADWLGQALGTRRDLVTRWLLSLAGGAALDLAPESADEALLAGLVFEDVATELGVAKYDGAGPSAWGDYDGDGDLDLFVAGCDTYCALYRNTGGHFSDVSREAGLLDVPSGFSATFADYDGDGDIDLYIGRNGWSGPAPNSLYRNLGDGRFEDVTASAGVGHTGSSFTHAWSDLDRDGWLDLVVANGITGDGAINTVYRNDGAGGFEDVTVAWGLAEEPGTRTIGIAVGDYDKDGWPDVFYNSWDTRNRLYHNLGEGHFEEVARKAGVDGGGRAQSGYVAFFFDYDGDAWPDLLTTRLGGFRDTLKGQLARYEPTPQALAMSTHLYRNLGDGRFEDVSVQVGFVHPHGTMGANIGDLNNDGWVDLYLGTGDPHIERLEPNAFYANVGGQHFVELTRATGLGHLGKGHGITFADYDFDGDLDIYSPQGGFEHGDQWPNALYRNERGNANAWVALLPEGTASNRMGVGAQVTLRAGGRVFYKEVTAGGAFGSSSTPYLHFGLGDAETIDSLEVRWPSGAEQRHEQVPIRRFLRMVEGAETLQPITPGPGAGSQAGG